MITGTSAGSSRGLRFGRAAQKLGAPGAGLRMVTFLYSLSDLAIAVLFSLTIALGFMAAPLLRHKLFGEVSDPVSDFVRATMTPITGFTGVVLAFSLVQAQGNLRSVQKTVSMEALQLNQLDRLAISYGPELIPVRQAARDPAAGHCPDCASKLWLLT